LNADLLNADLSHANLEGTNLIGTQNLILTSFPKVKTHYNARLDDELGKSLGESYSFFLKSMMMNRELRSVKD